MASAGDFAKMVPGFDFLQKLMKGASSALPGMPGVGALPGMSQWIAPTLDPEELDKRINELKTVQFWLEQNARLLGTTIQALEVQRMTLSTLQTLNLPLADLREALKIKVPEVQPWQPAAPARESEPEPEPEPEPEIDAEAEAPVAAQAEAESAAEPEPAARPAVDPLKWWGALTQQFTELAARAVQDSAAEALRRPAAEAAAVPRQAAKKVARKVAKKAVKKSSTKEAPAPRKAARPSAAETRSRAGRAAPVRER